MSRLAIRTTALVAGLLAMAALGAQEPAGRKELRRVELSGAPGMELIASISEFAPDEIVPRHIHHGVEAAYVIQGAMVEVSGKAPQMLPTGADLLNLRDMPHAGFKVVGDHALKLYTVHVVDKGKPLYDATAN